MKNNWVLIPARGGSKRIPGKNLKTLGGLPLIAYSIKAGLAAKEISKVFVSSDDPFILEIAKQYGASPVIRPSVISDDHSPTVLAVQHFLNEAGTKIGLPDALVTLQPTNPFRKPGLIDEALELFWKHPESESLTCVSENNHKLGVVSGGLFQPSLYRQGQRTQDLDKLFFENGLIYISKASLIIENGKMMGEKNLAFIQNGIFSKIDIDDSLDWELAEFAISKYKGLLSYL